MVGYDPFVAGPDWHHWIIWYFYLGGIAAGAHASASMARLFGDDSDRRAARASDYLATPLIAVCGVFLVVDLGRPERFWHMLIQSETYRPMFKWWSPMSAGSWGLSAFGASAGLWFVAALAEDDKLGLARFAPMARWLGRGILGKILAVGGFAASCFLGSYTGGLLNATNQPVWAQSTWMAPLFLASAASTGVAATTLLIRWRRPDTPHAAVDRLGRFESVAIVLEGLMLLGFAWSLGDLAPSALLRWPGVLVPAVVVPFGLVLPLIAHRLPGDRWHLTAPILVLAAGFALRYAVVEMPGPLLRGS